MHYANLSNQWKGTRAQCIALLQPPLPLAGPVKSPGRRISLHHAKDVALAIFVVGEPANAGNRHLRESQRGALRCSLCYSLVDVWHINGADISDDRDEFHPITRDR